MRLRQVPFRSSIWRSTSASTSSGSLASGRPPLVAGDHELADLDPEGGVLAALLAGRGRGVGHRVEREQPLHLRLDVDGLLAAAGLPVVAGLHELADLGLALGARERSAGHGAGRPSRRGAGRLVDREAAPAELVQKAESAREKDRGDRRDHQHDDPDHGPEIHPRESRRRLLESHPSGYSLAAPVILTHESIVLAFAPATPYFLPKGDLSSG